LWRTPQGLAVVCLKKTAKRGNPIRREYQYGQLGLHEKKVRLG